MVLELLNLLLQTVLRKDTHAPQEENRYIPHDICTVHKKFNLEPSTQTFATCIRCCCTYALMSKKTTYPKRCTFMWYHGGKPCRQLLIRTIKSGSSRVCTPVQPFVVQNFNNFLVGLLSHLGMEEAMERSTRLNDKHQLWDIKDGTGITEMMGPDGKPFMDGLPRKELRLAWSLSVDWFNPHQNKMAGKKKSVGSIAMMLLNLPPTLCYKPENLYFFGVIPGPREPSQDKINHFLRPLMNFSCPRGRMGPGLQE